MRTLKARGITVVTHAQLGCIAHCLREHAHLEVGGVLLSEGHELQVRKYCVWLFVWCASVCMQTRVSASTHACV